MGCHNFFAFSFIDALTTNDVRGIADGGGFVADGQDWFGAGKGISVNDGTGPDPLSTLFPGQLFMSLVTGGGYYETLFLPYGFHASRVIEEEGWQWKEADILLPRVEGTVTLATEGHVAAAAAAAVRKGEANEVGDAFELWGRGFTHKRHTFFVGEEINAQAAKGTTVLLDGAAGAVVLTDYSPEAPVMSELTVAPDGTFALQWGEAPKTVFALPRDGAGGTLATEGHVAAAAAGKVSSATVAAIWTGTQGEYDAINVPDPQTLYIILEDGP